MHKTKPLLILRLQTHNIVSFGALLGACPNTLLDRFEVVLWRIREPLPPTLGKRPAMIAFSFMMPHVEGARKDVQMIRSGYSESRHPPFLVAGGTQVTADPEGSLAVGFDAVLPGEGENSFPRLLESWSEGLEISGILPSPGRTVLDDFPGFHPLIGYLPPIEMSRGCRYGCAYCVVPFLYGGTIRHRSVKKILEIASEYLKLNERRRRVKFLASNAFAYGSEDGHTPNLEAISSLLHGLREVGVREISLGSFPGEVRPDFVTREVLEIVKPFITNRTIVMGVQSGSDRALRSMGRGHSREQAVEAIRLLREFGYTPHVDFIIGLPGETQKDQLELLTFMEELVNTYSIRIHMHTFMPLPGARWGDKVAAAIRPVARERLKALSRAKVLDGWWENQIAYSRRKL